MASKRSYAEVEASGASRDGAYKKRKPFSSHHKSSREGYDSNSAANGQTLNEVKKRARDIERRFARGVDLPSDVQRNLQLELAHCKKQIEDLQHKKKRNDMISRYHKVRFFERQKAERFKKQLKKRLDNAVDTQEDKTQLEEDFHRADVDWHYTKYFPFMERYISLYPAGQVRDDAGEEPTAKRALRLERPPVWKEIEEAMKQGQDALDRIQERRLEPPNTATSAVETAAPIQTSRNSKGKEAKSDKGDRPQQKAKAAKPTEVQGNRRERRRALAEGKQQHQAEDQDSGNDSDFFG
ncbi:hypothetical protein BD289DRAFT_480704 [Coniella lustricola]|uniref:rRNA-processing protein EFG1 n=1 Tax=Coniella lustricola TaxID=2025994 RepID=A0A2T3AET0_9PEZI|nr:hypothetical protein BD289DRAFT_480704 [Coniella lustricola]